MSQEFQPSGNRDPLYSRHRIDPVSGPTALWISPVLRVTVGLRFKLPLLPVGAVPLHVDMGFPASRRDEPEALVEAPCRHVRPEDAELDGHITRGCLRPELDQRRVPTPRP